MPLITVDKRNEGFYFLLIGILSIAIPLGMAIVLFTPPVLIVPILSFHWLLTLNAIFSLAICVLISVSALLFYLKKSHQVFQRLTVLAFLLSILFYFAHMGYYLHEELIFFGDEDGNRIISAVEKGKIGSLRFLYFILFVLHTLFGVFLVPLILLSQYFLYSRQSIRFQKTLSWVLPIWFFVSLSYVVLYGLLYPYIPH